MKLLAEERQFQVILLTSEVADVGTKLQTSVFQLEESRQTDSQLIHDTPFHRPIEVPSNLQDYVQQSSKKKKKDSDMGVLWKLSVCDALQSAVRVQ